MAKNARGVNAVQQNLAGTGIGRLASFTDIRSCCFEYNQHPLSKPVACGCSFNDRIRDTCLGGSPFGDPLRQGLLTGLALAVRHCLHISQQCYLKQQWFDNFVREYSDNFARLLVSAAKRFVPGR